MGGEGRLTTADVDVRFLGPATADPVGEVNVVHAGDSIGVTRLDVSQRPPDAGPEFVAIGSTTYRLFTGGG